MTTEKPVLIFDVDETLAPSGEPLSASMCNMLDYLSAIYGYQIAFATSRSYSELQKRIPECLLVQAYAFTCMGLECWNEGKMVYQHHFSWPAGLRRLLEVLVNECDHPHKTGSHIIHRPSKGAVTFLGEGASPKSRQAFIEWNKKTNYLNRATAVIRVNFPKLHVKPFGKTSIDFSNKELSKSIVLKKLREFTQAPITFFGDSMQPEGNDHDLMEALHREKLANGTNKCHWVKHPDETYSILSALKNAN